MLHHGFNSGTNESNSVNLITKIVLLCCKPYPWFTRITWFAWRFDAHWVIAMDIPIRHGYFVFRVALRPRIMQSARDIAPLAQSIISKVARIASWNEPYHYYGFRATGAVSVMTRHNSKGGVTSMPGDFHRRQHNVPSPLRSHTVPGLFTNAFEECYNWARIWPSLVALPRYH